MAQKRLNISAPGRVAQWWACRTKDLVVRFPVEANFLSGVFSPLTSAEACEKSSRWLWKESCVSRYTGVRKSGNTCASPTPMIIMTPAVKVALNADTINQSFNIYALIPLCMSSVFYFFFTFHQMSIACLHRKGVKKTRFVPKNVRVPGRLSIAETEVWRRFPSIFHTMQQNCKYPNRYFPLTLYYTIPTFTYVEGVQYFENIVGKGENAISQHFLLLPQCFLHHHHHHHHHNHHHHHLLLLIIFLLLFSSLFVSQVTEYDKAYPLVSELLIW